MSGVLDDLLNRTWITFKSEMCFIEWQGGPCSPAKTSQDNHLGEKSFSQSALIPSMESSSSSYCTNSLGPTLVYVWALPDTSELSLCTTNSCLSRMLPFSLFFAPPSPVLRLCFHLVLKCAPRFLSPVRHVDLSQGRARKASWSIAVLCHSQKFFNLF